MTQVYILKNIKKKKGYDSNQSRFILLGSNMVKNNSVILKLHVVIIDSFALMWGQILKVFNLKYLHSLHIAQAN